jgi:5'-nucleotidase / UDP-sugar diphosphatase
MLLAHTNDLHCHFRASPAPWLEGSPEIGGFVPIDAHVAALRATYGDDSVLYLDGGDLLTGTPLMEYPVHGAHGGAMVDLLASSGADAWVLGNHELDRGWENAAALIAASPIPALSANVRSSADPKQPGFPGLLRHVILEANDVTVGVFGLTTPSLSRLASAETMAHLDVWPLRNVAAAEVAALEPEVDLVVALTHTGIESDRRLAAQVPGIDLIVGGHSHTALVPPEKVGNTWIVQAGSYARQLGVLDITVEDGTIVRFNGELRNLFPDALPGPASVDTRALVKRWGDEIDEKYHTPVGQATGPLVKHSGDDTPLGRWAADIVAAHADADVGLYNRGGLRADLPGGSLTLGNLYEVFPFGNEVVVFDVTGDQLVVMALRGLHILTEKDYLPLEFGGLRITYGYRMGAPELEELLVGGEPVDPARTYTVATNSFVAAQWRHNLGFEPTDVRGTGQTVLQAAEAAVRRGPVVPPADPRVVRAR